MSSEAVLETEISDHVATLRMNRPKVLNALSLELMDAMGRKLVELHARADVRAIVLTGKGRAFCAGGDLRDLHDYGEGIGAGFRHGAGIFHNLSNGIRASKKPVIAALNGVAAGGGMSLALSCDFRVMSSATFMQAGYLGRGLSPDGGLSHFLPRLVGVAKAMEIVLLDERIPAEQCLALGLVTYLSDEPLTRAHELAQRLAAGPSVAQGFAKALISSSYGVSLAQQLERERLAIAESAESREGQEGLGAFIEKRAPNFVTPK